MALYGSKQGAEDLLRGAPNISIGPMFDARFPGIQAAVSAALEAELGRSFGEGPAAPEARVIMAGPYTSVLLDPPATSITAIQRYGTYDGTIYTGGVAMSAGDWVADPIDRYGTILGIRLGYGGIWGYADRYGRPATPILITGTWADQPAEAEPPAEITYIANFLIAEQYKNNTASPAQSIGPNGEYVPPRNPWKDELVKRTIDRYRTIQTLAF